MQIKKPEITSTTAVCRTGDRKEQENSWFVNDAWIAHQLQMKPGTIRVQRHRRSHGELHWFTIDPVLIGAKPRYVRTEVESWLRGKKDNPH